MAVTANKIDSHDRERVILVHGLGGWPSLLQPLARHLEAVGFGTHCWGYTSIRRPIAQSAKLLAAYLETHLRQTHQPVHLLTHSMGGILARAIVNDVTPTGKLLMLAPPHRGSPVARRLGRWLGAICHPLNELADVPSSFVNQLPPLPESLSAGIIAASRDRVIPPGNTRMNRDIHHVTVNAGHTSMLFKPVVANLCEAFLQHGQFAPAAPHDTPSSEQVAGTV